MLGGITGNHCGDDSAFLTDAVKTVVSDAYLFLLVFIALAFIRIGAYKGITYRIVSSIKSVSTPKPISSDTTV